MKKLKLVIIVTVLTIAVQQVIFIYIEKKYLTSNNITIEKVETKEENKESKEEINLSSHISDLKVSQDGHYVAYKNEDKLEVLDILRGTKKQVNRENINNIEFYKWLNNDDNMIVINKYKDGDKFYLEPVAYNAKNDEERDISDFDLNKIKIDAKEGDKIDDVSFSTLTHSIYINVKKENQCNDLYYANVMNQIERVKENEGIGKIVVPPSNTNAVMQIDGEIKVLNKDENIKVPNVSDVEILGVDINDNVYFSKGNNQLVKEIYFSDFSSKNYNWNNYNLEKEVIKDDIIIDYSGKIYINYKDESYVLEVTSNKIINYTGVVLQSYAEGIVVRDGDRLIKYKLN